ncbi:hypothetical protein BDY19DRAFT_992139 [Irpex rosettiformis]|uniref:Uncharacterized protein n=1 Tax=Irpex rosettiformis TaxID=378272 RepID=A0ACB8U9T0_9APHY|nr:hypothetical protein BDY19DRAFT_992139 [Irpex rosettiformis]
MHILEGQAQIWFYAPSYDGQVPVIPNYNRMSTLLSQLVTTHLGLLYSFMTRVSLPYDPVNVATLSVILLLILWSDTTPGDILSRADRAATRKFIANCLGFSYLVIFILYSQETTARIMGLVTLLSLMTFNFLDGSELFEYRCLMCKLREHSQRQDSTFMDIESPCVGSGVRVEEPVYEELRESSRRRPKPL